MVDQSILTLLESRAIGPKETDLSRRQIEILDQMEAMFVNEGFRHLTISILAERLGCSRRTLYDIAESRTELNLVVIERRLRKVTKAAIESVNSVKSGFKKFTIAIASKPEFSYTQKFLDDVRRDPAARRITAEHLEVYGSMLKLILDEAAAAGEIRPQSTAVTAAIAQAAMELFLTPEFQARTGLDYEQARTEMLLIFQQGIFLEGKNA